MNPHSVQNVKSELQDLLSSSDNTRIFDLGGESISEPTINAVLFADKTQGDNLKLDRLFRLPMLSDSANCYGPILSGHPKTGGKSVRIQLFSIRDLCHRLALTFIDEGYNLADSLTKNKNGHHGLLTTFLQSGMFKVGFFRQTDGEETAYRF